MSAAAPETSPLPRVTRVFQTYPFLQNNFSFMTVFEVNVPLNSVNSIRSIYFLVAGSFKQKAFSCIRFDRLHLVSFHSFARPEFLNASVSSKAWICDSEILSYGGTTKVCSKGFVGIFVNPLLGGWAPRTDGYVVISNKPPFTSHEVRPFGRETTILRGLRITMVINHLLTGMSLQKGFTW